MDFPVFVEPRKKSVIDFGSGGSNGEKVAYVHCRIQTRSGSIDGNQWKSIDQLARDLGVSDSALHSWRKSIAHHGNQALPGKGHQTELEEKLRYLERENGICVKSVIF